MRASPNLFETLEVGAPLPGVTKGPMTTSHIMRWSAAMENWHRIHYDWRFATQHDHLPDVVVSGSWKQHVLIQMLADWTEPRGWVWKTSFRFDDTDLAGDTLEAWARVAGKERRGKYGVVSLVVGLRNQRGIEGTSGTAEVILPLAGGPEVPYPFDPASLAANWTASDA